MSVNSSRSRTAAPPVLAALLPIIAAVFIAFLVIGLALPVLPLHVHQGLGLGTFVVGLVAGAQFGASLLSRFWAGAYADSRSAKRALVTGLLVAAVAGLLYSYRYASSASRRYRSRSCCWAARCSPCGS
jgi:MFS family permease